MSQFEAIANMLDAAKSKSNYTHNSITYDFSGFNAEIACVICGHCHQDGTTQTTGGIRMICTTCDRGPDNNSAEEFNNVRAYGTINEQAIDVFMIDTTDKVIKTIRIGGSWDGEGAMQNPDRTFSYGA